MARIPEFAYSWRPFASRALIFKPVKDRDGEDCFFAIDPHSQRWALVKTASAAALRLCDGRTRFATIIQAVARDMGRDWDPLLFASRLAEAGLIYDSAAQHRSVSREVYNSCEPIGLHLEITNACNMVCTHCYVESGDKLPGEMSHEEILRTIDMLPPFSGKRLAISGGEPIVRRGCLDIIEHACLTCGHDVDLYTNGRKFPEKFARQILAINDQGLGQVRLQLSLEGASAITHDLVRGPGAFADAMESLALFETLGLAPVVILFVCLTKANIADVDALIALAEEHGVGMLVFSQWQRQGNAANTPWAMIAPTTQEWVAVGEKLLAYRHPSLQIYGNFFGDLSNGGPLCLDSPLFPKHLYYYNAFPRITPQGHILADQLWVDPNWFLGNVKDEQALEPVFQTPKYHEQLHAMRRRSEAIDECRSCEWRLLCEGGSPGHTYAEYGHMNEKDLFCDSRKYWFERYVDHKAARTAVTVA